MNPPVLTINEGRHEVFVDKREVRLSYKEFEILKELKSDRNTHSREDLLESVWGKDRDDITDTRTVDQHIARLRRKLNANFIITVPRRGYKFAA